MTTGKKDLLQAIIDAFLMEKGTKDFYSQAAGYVADKEAKQTFKKLSEWEGLHMDFLQFLYQSVQDDRDIEGFEEFKSRTPSPVTETGIPVKDLTAKIKRHRFTDESQVLTLAMEIDGKAYNHYCKLSQSAPDANARIVFREMMEQELRHIDYLKALRLKFDKVYDN